MGAHPPSFCNTCYVKAKKYTVGGKHVLSAVTVHQWSPHTATDCSACNLFANQLRGGRPKKGRKNRGRPDNSSSQILADISERAPPSWRASQPLVLSRFLPPASSISLRDLQCAICQCIVDQPVEMPCRKLVCCKCITHTIRRFEPATLQCPCSDAPHDVPGLIYFTSTRGCNEDSWGASHPV